MTLLIWQALLIFIISKLSQAKIDHSKDYTIPSDSECGKNNVKRIVGGHQAKPHAWRWQVAVYEQPSWSNSDKDWNFICGASILNQRFVLCASHCVSSFGSVTKASRIKLMLGAHNRTKNDGLWVKVEKIITHPKYEENLMQNDIALFKLKESIDFTKHNGTIAPVCIGDRKMLNENLTNEMACVTGWGTTQAMGSVSPVLNEVSVPIVSKEDCIKSYDKDSITDCNICAGFAKGQKDSCQGDSGGPCVIRRNDRWIQIGITSWGRGCAEPNAYGVYASVPYLHPWIVGELAKERKLHGKNPKLIQNSTRKRTQN